MGQKWKKAGAAEGGSSGDDTAAQLFRELLVLNVAMCVVSASALWLVQTIRLIILSNMNLIPCTAFLV